MLKYILLTLAALVTVKGNCLFPDDGSQMCADFNNYITNGASSSATAIAGTVLMFATPTSYGISNPVCLCDTDVDPDATATVAAIVNAMNIGAGSPCQIVSQADAVIAGASDGAYTLSAFIPNSVVTAYTPLCFENWAPINVFGVSIPVGDLLSGAQ